MVAISSEEENGFLTSTFGSSVHFIGAYVFDTSNVHVSAMWVNEEPMNYMNWGGQITSSTHHCVKLTGDGQWYTSDCNDPLYFICEKPLS